MEDDEAYREYLERHDYFGGSLLPRLARADFLALDAEWRSLAGRHDRLTAEERARLTALKAVLMRDKP